MIQVYDRSNKRLIDEEEVSVGLIRSLYHSIPGRLLLKILCRKPISNCYALYQKSPFTRKKVTKFVDHFHISLDDCESKKYRNFNEFFTRKRVRYIDQTQANELPAIADSKLTVYPIDKNSRFSIKKSVYTIEELLENEVYAQRYLGGYCLVFRLTPDDYHRYVYPDRGTQSDVNEIRGVLHTVNPVAANYRVYARNTRHWTVLRTEHFGELVQMEVGAMLVGKIRNHKTEAAQFEKLQEKGYFEYGGSTVILLIPKNSVKIDEDILEYSAKGIETKVKIGERIGVK